MGFRSRVNCLLDAHVNAEAFLGTDEMVGVLGILSQVDLDPVDIAAEFVVARTVIVNRNDFPCYSIRERMNIR